MSLNTADHLLEAGADDDVAVVDGARRYTYADLRTAAGRLAAELAALGLEPGARVAVLGANSFFWIAGYLAAIKLGHVAVPLSDRSTAADVVRNLGLVGCSAVLADRTGHRRFAAAVEGLPVVTDAALDDGREPYWPEADVDLDADAVLLFTSGSTSTPKAVRLTHRNIRANTASIIEFLGLRRDDRVLVILPFYYCYGASLLHTHLRVGGRVVLCRSFAFPEVALDLLEEQECTVFAGVPSSFPLLARAGTLLARPLPSLRIVQQAGGRLPPVLVEELRAAKNSAQLFVMYGQTEATARLSYLPPDRLADRPGSIGRGIPGVCLRVLDAEGRPVAAGERGEIYATGDNVSPGYYGDPEGSRSKFTERGLRTGDLAVVDDDGFITIVDRADDFIKSWGYRISSQEIESCVLGMDQLVSAAVIGVPDDTAGEAVALFVAARPGVSVVVPEIQAYCAAHLPKHMVPRVVEVLDTLPLNANGKIDKPRLRDRAANPVFAGRRGAG